MRAPDQRMNEMSSLFDAAFWRLPGAIAAAGLTIAGPALALYRSMPGETVDLEAGFPVVGDAEGPFHLGDGLEAVVSELPAGRCATVSHLGGYDGLGEAWQRFMGDVAARGEHPSLPFWGIYVTEPRPDMDPATLRTDLVTALS
ncbi:GyrI-like domain-containing protein [Brachybacterium huguangmaarense]